MLNEAQLPVLRGIQPIVVSSLSTWFNAPALRQVLCDTTHLSTASALLGFKAINKLQVDRPLSLFVCLFSNRVVINVFIGNRKHIN